jgi:flagellar protein FliO/FliZ
MDLIDYGRFLAALLFVLGLIGLTAWLARRFRLGTGAPHGAARRLAVLETLPLDARRKLVLIRRDASEHLLLLSPNGDRLVEGGIAGGCEVLGSYRREVFG